jgi:hypothetical protein
MTTLAEYVTELEPMLWQLEAAAAAGGSASGGQLFEWRIRARLVDEKLRLASKPAVPPGEGNQLPGLVPPQFAFGDHAAKNAQSALPYITVMRQALEKGKVPLALDQARAIHRLIVEAAPI